MIIIVFDETSVNMFSFKDIDMDYMAKEKNSEIHTFPIDFGWSDLGSWELVYSAI